MLVLGIDPGSKILGIGVVDFSSNQPKYITSGCLRIDKNLSHRKKILQIYNSVEELIQKYHPTCISLEKSFTGINVHSTLVLSQIRGVIMLLSAQHDMEFFEYSPKTIKLKVAGNGSATKDKVNYMVQSILNLSSAPQEDASDALAIAICRCYDSAQI
jgi:crossover junction endodeoxyribonuclease RuvC